MEKPFASVRSSSHWVCWAIVTCARVFFFPFPLRCLVSRNVGLTVIRKPHRCPGLSASRKAPVSRTVTPSSVAYPAVSTISEGSIGTGLET